LNKTAESDAVFSKVSFLAIFIGNKIREKYYASFSCEEGVLAPKGHEGVLEAQTTMAHAARFPGYVGPARLALKHRLASSFCVHLHIYQKGVTYERKAIRKTERHQSHDHQFWDQIDPGFLPQRRGSEAVFTAIFTAFISINHELHLHHHA
jgi:hypothetical protein